MRILVSNDDGIDAPGLRALVDALSDIAEVWICAPDRERSAVSHAISLHTPLRAERRGEREFSCDGTPTDCVYLALNHFMPEPPDLILSGINKGANLGNDVLYSGTVSAAMEGALFGYQAAALSLCLPDDQAAAGAQEHHFETAAAFARSLAKAICNADFAPGVMLNVNVPNRPQSELAGVKVARLGYTDWTDAVIERHDPRRRPYYWIGGDRTGHDDIADSDNNGISSGYITVTPIHYDLTDYRAFAATRTLGLRFADDGFELGSDALGNEPLPHPVHPRLNRRG